ncbi:MAG: dipeptide/oligopeptide/nickel ABC transporter permease/ATP-binding protein [Propionibacteriaceae bacterium]|jgi:oligopeptide/dipeptide ABC transporter ATP-binding protein|nr:dipeptide/oligopeptide/nickel ABC transporter permease/ATP-binding protein [Propionibacteriaceae bacterium]
MSTTASVAAPASSQSTAPAGSDGPAKASGLSNRFAWLQGLKSPKTMVGLIILAVFILLAIFGPIFAPYDPSSVSWETLQPPSAAHWLGTTQAGQDVFSQMLYGARISIIVGFCAALLATAVSVLVGLVAGYLGGLTDDILSLLANVFLVLPSLPLAVILVALLPKSGSAGIILIIAITGWAWGSRVLRAQTMSLRRRDFVEAARATGERTRSIILHDIMPNEMAIIASSFLGTVTGAILTQASLSFLGLTSVSEWSWGTILYWAQVNSALLMGAWWWFIPAGLAIALLGTSMSLINFGIDEFINPRLRQANAGTKAAAKARKAEAKARRRGAVGLPTRAKVRPIDQAGTDTTQAAVSVDSSGRAARAEGTGSSVAAKRAAGDVTKASLSANPAVGSASHPTTDPSVVLDVRDLVFGYGIGDDATVAVNHVSLTVRRGEVLGVAGESGSGKSTLANAIARLYRRDAATISGQLLYTDAAGTTTDILTMGEEQLRRFRWDELSVVFQSAMNALNPVLTIGTQIDDVLRDHRADMTKSERQAKTRELLELVGIQPDRVKAYPHELSGGMRQRAMIAIGLALDPEIIIMDEPTTALDVVIQRQIIEQLIELKDRLGFTIIFITHDLSLLIELSDTIAIMYAGRLVECSPTSQFYLTPEHPYSQGLLRSFPTLSGPKRALTGIPGSPPDLRRLPHGCPFAPRCDRADDLCLQERASLKHLVINGVTVEVACHHPETVSDLKEVSHV